MSFLYSEFHAEQFKHQVAEALISVERVLLDAATAPPPSKTVPRLAEAVEHTYTDTYHLANSVTNTAIIACLTALEGLGVTKAMLQIVGQQQQQNKATRSTTLRFRATEQCRYVNSERLDLAVPGSTKNTIEQTTVAQELEFGAEDTTTTKTTIATIVQRVIRQHYTMELDWDVSIITGSSNDEEEEDAHRHSITTRQHQNNNNNNKQGLGYDFYQDIPNTTTMTSSATEDANTNTTTKTSEDKEDATVPNPVGTLPFRATTSIDPIDVSLTWLLQNIDTEEWKAHFAIDTTTTAPPPSAATTTTGRTTASRTHKRMKPTATTTTITPVRNRQIEHALIFFSALQDWTEQVATYIGNYKKFLQAGDDPDDGGYHHLLSQYAINSRGRNFSTTVVPQTSNKKKKHNNSNIFIPILPLLHEKDEDEDDEDDEDDDDDESSRLPNNDGNKKDNRNTATTIAFKSKAILSLPEGDETMASSLSTVEAHPSVSSSSAPILSIADTTSLLNEQVRTLHIVQHKLKQEYPTTTNNNEKKNKILISYPDANLYVLCHHIQELVHQYISSMMYMEYLVEQQLIAAMGKKITSTDLDKFMVYHNAQLFRPSPQPFCYSIRQPDHYPDGIVTIEKGDDDDAYNCGRKVTTMTPISTHVREIATTIAATNRLTTPATTATTPAMTTRIPLNSATTIELTGKIYLHGWLNHRFGGHDDCAAASSSASTSSTVQLTARARQFSSFVLLVGTMANNNCLQLKEAIIVRNKDTLTIPLLLNELPTGTEFKNAISSLSPEQQRFAKAFRSMQLATSVLGIAIIQLKPQLEKLLNLPYNSLTKEMKLTEDLTELFVDYQIPSDLVSYDQKEGGRRCDEEEDTATASNNNDDGRTGEGREVPVKEQVKIVKEHVKSVLDIIAGQKKEQFEEQTQRHELERQKKEINSNNNGGRSAYHNNGNSFATASRQGRRRMFGTKVGGTSPVPPPSSKMRMLAAASPTALHACTAVSASTDFMDHGMQQPGIMEATNNNSGRELVEENNTCINEYQSSENVSTNNETQASDTSMSNDFNMVKNFNLVPQALDTAIERNDKDSSIRATTIEPAKEGWIRNRQPNLLSKFKKESLTSTEIVSEKNKALDLLDALSRSGSLAIPFSELHVVICATHQFEKTVMETVIQDNINPIEKLEMSTLLMASTILDTPARNLLRNEGEYNRLVKFFPRLFDVSSDIDRNDAITTTAPASSLSPSSVASSATSSTVATMQVNNCTVKTLDSDSSSAEI